MFLVVICLVIIHPWPWILFYRRIPKGSKGPAFGESPFISTREVHHFRCGSNGLTRSIEKCRWKTGRRRVATGRDLPLLISRLWHHHKAQHVLTVKTQTSLLTEKIEHPDPMASAGSDGFVLFPSTLV